MAMVIIRRATPADAAAVLSLRLREAARGRFALETPPRRSLKLQRRRLSSPRRIELVATDSLGFAGWMSLRPRASDTTVLRLTLLITDRARSRGFGRRLLEVGLLAVPLGYSVEARAIEENTPARALYASLGFTECRMIPVVRLRGGIAARAIVMAWSAGQDPGNRGTTPP